MDKLESDLSKPVTCTKFTFTKQKFQLERKIEGPKWDEIIKYLTNTSVNCDSNVGISLQKMYYVMIESTFLKKPTEKIKVIYRYLVPRSWWQMFKRDLLSQWFINLFPIKNRIKRTRPKVVFVNSFYASARDLSIPPEFDFSFMKFEPEDDSLQVTEHET